MRTLLLILAVPAIASAQTTNTNCLVNGQWINCTTNGPIGGTSTAPTDFLTGMGGVRNMPRPSMPLMQVAPADNSPSAVAAALIARGQCPAAIQYLRQAGESVMADRAVQVCLNTSPPK